MAEHFIAPETAQKGLLECAAFLAENIKNSDGHSEALKAVVPLFLRRGDVDMAAELANSIEDPFTRQKLLIEIAEKCAAIDDDEYAMQLAEAIEDQGLQAQAFEKIALQKSLKGDFEAADALADEMSHPEYVYADIAVRQSANSKPIESEIFLAKIDYPVAEVSALQAIAEMYHNGGEVEKANEMLERVRIEANEIEHGEEQLRVICELGNLYIRFGNPASAVQTFERARELAAELESGHRDFFLVSTALGSLQAGDLELADEALDLVTDKTQMASGLLGFSKEFSKNANADEALETLEEAYSILRSQRDKEVRDTRAKLAVHRMIAVQFAALEKPERAIEVAQEIPNDDERSTALAQIAQVLSSVKPEMAEQAIHAIAEDSNRLFALISISDAQRSSGDVQGSLATLDEVAKLSETVDQVAARSAVLNEIARRYAAGDAPDKAREICFESLETISTIRDESRRAAALANLADIYESYGFEIGEREKEILGQLVRRFTW